MKHLGTKKIETGRLSLRAFQIEDADAMYQNWASEENVTKYLTWPAHSSVEVTKAVIADWISHYGEENYYQWCIELKEIGEPIGSIAVVCMREEIKEVGIGYCIGSKFWQQGIMSEALSAVIRFFFEEVGMNRVVATHDAKNPNSGKVMAKCGMTKEGVKRQGGLNNTGICDTVMYAILKQDYEGQMQTEGTTADEAAKPVARTTGKNVISDETIEYVGILAKLELNDEEKEHAKKDMEEMLDYIDKLNELDTTGVEPMSHVFPVNNVFREDVVTNGDGSEATLANAPLQKDGGFKVPKTIG